MAAAAVIDRKELGRRLHMLRFDRFTLLQVEQATGIPQSNLSRLERGIGRTDPKMGVLIRLARFYGVDWRDLVDPDFDTRAWTNRRRQTSAAARLSRVAML
jgi:transcriptional regulator with XRE-family HTH domain